MGADFYLYDIRAPLGVDKNNVGEVAKSIARGWSRDRFLEILMWVHEDTSFELEGGEAAYDSNYEVTEAEEDGLREELAALMVQCFGAICDSDRRVVRGQMYGILTWFVGDKTWGDGVELSDELVFLDLSGLSDYGWTKEKLREEFEAHLSELLLPEK